MPRASWITKRPERPSLTATQVALQFVTQLQEGGRPSIEAALDQAPAGEWADLLQSLLIAEVNARRTRGESPSARDYLPRFPAHPHVVWAVLPEYMPPSPALESPPPPNRRTIDPESTADRVAAPMAMSVPPMFEHVERGPASATGRRRRRVVPGVMIFLVAATVVPLTVFPRRQSVIETPHGPPARAPKAAINLFAKAAAIDPERDLAEWVLSIGGRGVALPDGASRRPFGGDTPLPKVKFAVTAIILPPDAAGRWKPDDLDRVRGRDKLQTIVLHASRPMTEVDLAPLAGLPLRTLELHAPAIWAPGALFASFPDLEALVLPHCPGLGDSDLAAIGRLARLSALTLNTSKLTANGFRELRCPGLKSLRLGEDVAVTPDHMRHLQRLPLEELECAAEVTDDAFVELALFLELKRLRLRRAAITDVGLRAVAGLGKLEEFRAEGSAVTGPGLEHLVERKGLQVLDLSGGKLTNDALGALLGLPDLRELRLAGNPLTDDAAILLAQLERVEVLDLGETGLTDAGLAMLKGHATLRGLIVTNTRVTGPGVQDFEAGTPACKVTHGKRR